MFPFHWFRRRPNSPQPKRPSCRLRVERLEERDQPAVAAAGLEVTTYFTYTTAVDVNGPTELAFAQGGLFADDLYFTDNNTRQVYRLNDINLDHDAADVGEGTLLYQFPIGSVDRPQNLLFGNGVGTWGNEMYLVDDGPNLMFRVSDNTGSFVVSTFANFNVFGIPTPTGATFTPDGQFMLVADCQNFTVFGGTNDGRVYRVSQTGAVSLWTTGGKLPNGLWDNSGPVAMTSDGWFTMGNATIGGITGPAQMVQFRDNNNDGDALDDGEGRVLIGTNVPVLNKRIFAFDSNGILYVASGASVFRLEDLNHDGDYFDTPANAFDAGESTTVLTSAGLAVTTLRVGPDGALYVGARETAKRGAVYRLADANDAPTANPGGPYSVPEGGSISLSGAGSSDPDGTVAIYEWDLDYAAPTFNVDATGATPTFSAAGLDGLSGRTIALRVTDNLGAVSSIVTTTVSITNVAPTIVSVGNDGPVDEGSPVLVTVAAADPAASNDPLVYEFDFDNDGVFEIGPQAGASATHTYADNGSYLVNIRVSDGDGGANVSSTTVTVDNVAPTIISVGNNGPVDEGSPVLVTVAAADPAGSNDPLVYEFDFDNDGVFEIGPQAGTSATHTYADNGSYLVNVRVSDGDGGANVSSTTVTVNNVAGPTVLDISAGPGQVNLNGAGVLPIRLFGSAGFNVTTLDLVTLRFGGAAAVHAAFQDADGDGHMDLILHFQRTDFVDEYAAALAADLEDGTLDSNHQNVAILFSGKTIAGVDVSGILTLDLFMTGKKLDQLLATL